MQDKTDNMSTANEDGNWKARQSDSWEVKPVGEKVYTEKDIKDAYESGYSEGIGKEWDDEHGYYTPTFDDYIKELKG